MLFSSRLCFSCSVFSKLRKFSFLILLGKVCRAKKDAISIFVLIIIYFTFHLPCLLSAASNSGTYISVSLFLVVSANPYLPFLLPLLSGSLSGSSCCLSYHVVLSLPLPLSLCIFYCSFFVSSFHSDLIHIHHRLSMYFPQL